MTATEQTSTAPRTEVASYRVYPSNYETSPLVGKDNFVIVVECIDDAQDVWVVRSFPYFLSANGAWLYVAQLHHLDEPDRGAFRHTRIEALRLAAAHVDDLSVNGKTFAEWAAHFTPKV